MRSYSTALIVKGIICIILLHATTAIGETTFGLKAGLNLARWDVENYANLLGDQSFRKGFAAGIFASRSINERIWFQPEILFTMKGAKYTDKFYITGPDSPEILGEGTILITYKLNHVEIPLLLKYQLSPLKKQLYLFIGPSIAYKLSSKVTVAYDLPDNFEIEMPDIDDEDFDAAKVDFSLTIGGSIDLLSRLALDLRYNIGLTTSKEDDFLFAFKNRVISIMIDYRF